MGRGLPFVFHYISISEVLTVVVAKLFSGFSISILFFIDLLTDQKVSLTFHDNCGKKIRLTNNHQTAQRTSSDREDGIVMSRDPMLTDMLYQV